MIEDLRLTSINELERIWSQKSNNLKFEKHISDLCFEIIKKHSDPVFFLKDLGDYFLENENYFLAEFLYKRALCENPSCASVMTSYGILKYQNGNYEEAVDYSRQAIVGSGIFLKNLNLLGNAYLSLSEFDKAKKIYSALLLLNDSCEAYIGLVQVDYYQGKYNAVIEKCVILKHKISAENKTNLLEKYYYYHANSHKKLKDWNKAIDLFLSLLEIKSDKNTLFEIASLYAILENYKESSVYYLKLIELEVLNNEFNAVKYLLSILSSLTEDPEHLDSVIKALENLERSIKDFPDVAEVIVAIHNICGNHEIALNNAVLYLEKYKDSIELRRQVSLAYFYLKNDEDYLKSLKDILELQHSNKYALEKLIEFHFIRNENDLVSKYEKRLKAIED